MLFLRTLKSRPKWDSYITTSTLLSLYTKPSRMPSIPMEPRPTPKPTNSVLIRPVPILLHPDPNPPRTRELHPWTGRPKRSGHKRDPLEVPLPKPTSICPRLRTKKSPVLSQPIQTERHRGNHQSKITPGITAKKSLQKFSHFSQNRPNSLPKESLLLSVESSRPD